MNGLVKTLINEREQDAARLKQLMQSRCVGAAAL
jgi:hypothetical protein